MKKGLLLVLVSVCTLQTFAASSAFATPEQPCADVETVFARGSGQVVNKEDLEAYTFFRNLDNKIPNAIKINRYELGTQSYSNHKYPAIDITWGAIPNENAAGAVFSAGMAFDYGKSVNEGTLELLGYLTDRRIKCPDSRFILGGFSQGAQVIGQGLSLIPSYMRADIDFVALFGDPKLYLPEGEGFNPPACRGENLSPWRRSIGTCNTDNGSLGARTPYLPEDMKSKTGLWCNKSDYICGSSKNALINGGHGEYRNTHGAIDQSIEDIVNKLKSSLSPDLASHLHDDQEIGIGYGVDENIPDNPLPPQIHTPLDVAIIVEAPIDLQTQLEVSGFTGKIIAKGGRVALASYSSDEPPVLHGDFQTNSADFTNQLLALTGNPTTQPKNLLSSLTTTFNSLSWRQGAQKAAVVIASARFPTDESNGVTIKTVADLTLRIDPVNIYPVIPRNTSPAIKQLYDQLAEKTSGKAIALSTASGSLSKALSDITTRPVTKLKIPNYYAKPGQIITFDASDSYSPHSTILSYNWDFNGDGIFEKTTTVPTATHTYVDTFEGVMQVQLIAADDTASNASAPVVINTTSTFTKSVQPSVSIQRLTSGDIRLSWPASTNSTQWVVSVNEFPVGVTSDNHATITDVPSNKKATFSVAATENSEFSEVSPITKLKSSTSSRPGLQDVLSSHVQPEILGRQTEERPAPLIPTYLLWVAGSILIGILTYLLKIHMGSRK